MGRWDKILSKLPRYAGLAGAGAVGAAALMTPEEAQAAGVATIMEKLGIGLEDAKRVKQMAATNIAPDVFEQNIRALNDVKAVKNFPESHMPLGKGMDYQTYVAQHSPGSVVKVPIGYRGKIDPTAQYAPSLVEQAGLGPKTKTIQVGDKQYMVQGGVTPLDAIMKAARRPGQDPYLESLYKKKDALERVNSYNPPKESLPEIASLEQQIQDHQNRIYTKHGISPRDLESQYEKLSHEERGQFHGIDFREDPDAAFRKLLEIKAEAALEPKITPEDLHEGNVGIDPEGRQTIFDSSRFKNFRPANLSDIERQKIMESNIMLPEHKETLRQKLQGEDFGTVSDESDDMRSLQPPSHGTLDSNGNWRPKNTESYDWDSESGQLKRKSEIARKAAAGIAGATALGGLAGGTNQASAESVSPMPAINEGYEAFNKYIREPVAGAAHALSNRIVEGTTPLQGPEKQQFLEQNQPIFGGAAEMATDPVNYIPGGPELDMAMQFPKLKNYLQGKQNGP